MEGFITRTNAIGTINSTRVTRFNDSQASFFWDQLESSLGDMIYESNYIVKFREEDMEVGFWEMEDHLEFSEFVLEKSEGVLAMMAPASI